MPAAPVDFRRGRVYAARAMQPNTHNPMNTPPVVAAGLKLPRRHEAASNEPWPGAPVLGDHSLEAEFERLRECEANLRAYEARLREWQGRLDRGDAPAPEARPAAPLAADRDPAAEDAALRAAWAKLYRTRELLTAEQNHLRDERMSMQGREAEVKRREKAVEQREWQWAERERLAAEARTVPSDPPFPEKRLSRLEQLTQAPFALAKAVFSPGK